MGDTLRALEGDIELVNCSGFLDTDACAGADMCVTKYVWKQINDAISDAVDSIMLDQLVNESRELLEENGAEAVPCRN